MIGPICIDRNFDARDGSHIRKCRREWDGDDRKKLSGKILRFESQRVGWIHELSRRSPIAQKGDGEVPTPTPTQCCPVQIWARGRRSSEIRDLSHPLAYFHRTISPPLPYLFRVSLVFDLSVRFCWDFLDVFGVVLCQFVSGISSFSRCLSPSHEFICVLERGLLILYWYLLLIANSKSGFQRKSHRIFGVNL